MSKINNKYSKEFKLAVVKRYLQRNDGYQTVAREMNVKNDSQVFDWAKKYNTLREDVVDTETTGKAKGSRKGRPQTNFKTIEEELSHVFDFPKELV